jgi:hypothetical protein
MGHNGLHGVDPSSRLPPPTDPTCATASLATHGGSRVARRRSSLGVSWPGAVGCRCWAASTVADGSTGVQCTSRDAGSPHELPMIRLHRNRGPAADILPAAGRPREIARQSAAHGGTTFSILECGTGQRCSMTMVKHRSSGIDVGSRLAFGALFLAFMAFMGTMLQTCSSVLVNLPHR